MSPRAAPPDGPMAAVIHLRFHPGDLVILRGKAFRHVRGTAAGHVLEPRDAPGVRVTVSHGDMWREWFEPGTRHLPAVHDEAGACGAANGDGSVARRAPDEGEVRP